MNQNNQQASQNNFNPNYNQFSQPQNYYPQQYNNQLNTELKLNKKHRKISLNTNTLLTLILIVQIVTFVFLILIANPINVINQLQNQLLINEVAQKAALPNETPVIVLITDPESLKKDNPYQAEVYKNSQKGDLVLAYTNKMVIYRKSENKIVYDGETPEGLKTKEQKEITNLIIIKAKAEKIISSDSTEEPQISKVTNEANLKAGGNAFYKNAKDNDFVAIFVNAGKIIIYRKDTNQIINVGKYAVNIN